jgi:hypothetical protein
VVLLLFAVFAVSVAAARGAIQTTLAYSYTTLLIVVGLMPRGRGAHVSAARRSRVGREGGYQSGAARGVACARESANGARTAVGDARDGRRVVELGRERGAERRPTVRRGCLVCLRSFLCAVWVADRASVRIKPLDSSFDNETTPGPV